MLLATSSGVNFLISAILSTMNLTFAGSLVVPGVGDRYGPSVSVVSWFMLTFSTMLWNCWLRTIFVGTENM